MDEEDLTIASWLFAEIEIGDDKDKNPSSQSATSNKNIDKLTTRINATYRSKASSSSAVVYVECKSSDAANEFRKAGIVQTKQEDYAEALISYTKSVALAPPESEELYAAYDERSLTLLKLGKFVSCVRDVNRVLEGANCPQKLKKKMHVRKKECFEKYRQTTKHAMKVEATNEKRSKEWKICEFEAPNKLLPNSSSKIEVRSCDDGQGWGSEMRAKRHIDPGEVLSFEEYYAMALLPESRFKHCAYCLVKCDTLIPCPTCTQTMYCSTKCRTDAYDSYHRTECQIIKVYDRVTNYSYKEALAVQALLRGTEQGRLLPTLMAQMKPRDIFVPNRYSPRTPYVLDYHAVLRLCTPLDDEATALAGEVAVPTAVEVIIALKNTSFFPRSGESKRDRLSKVELFAAMLLINNILMMTSQDLRIWGTSGMREYVTSQTTYGAGLYVQQRFLNHSCCPNTCIVNNNRRRVLFAMRPIELGEPLFCANRWENTFASQPKEERPQWCKCEACVDEWPCFKELTELDTLQFTTESKYQEWFDILTARWEATRTLGLHEKVSDSAILQIVIEYLYFLYNNMETTKLSSDFISCQDHLMFAMDVFYSDYHARDVPRLLHDIRLLTHSLMDHARICMREIRSMAL